jgi:hypothetical protein
VNAEKGGQPDAFGAGYLYRWAEKTKTRMNNHAPDLMP